MIHAKTSTNTLKILFSIVLIAAAIIMAMKALGWLQVA
jgi:hypothetical protein